MRDSDYYKLLGPVEACAVVGDILWCSAYDFNLFFGIDVKAGKLECVSEIPREEKDGRRLYGSIVHHEGKLYLIPMAARAVAVYDIENRQFEKIELKEQDDENTMYKKGFKFCGGVVNDNKLAMFSCSYPAFVQVDLSNHSLEYHGEWVNDMEILSQKREEVYFRSFFTKDNKNIFLPACCTNHVMQFDLEKGNYSFIKVGENDLSFSDAVMIDNKLFISSKTEEAFYLFNMETHEIKTIYESDSKFSSVCMLSEDDAIYIIPYKLTHISAFENGEFIKYEIGNENGLPIVALKGILREGVVHIIPRGTENIITFDTRNRRFDTGSISFDRYTKAFLLKRINNRLVFQEGKVTLDDFISCMW